MVLQGDRVTLLVELLGFCLLKDAKTQSKVLKVEKVEMRKHQWMFVVSAQLVCKCQEGK